MQENQRRRLSSLKHGVLGQRFIRVGATRYLEKIKDAKKKEFKRFLQ